MHIKSMYMILISKKRHFVSLFKDSKMSIFLPGGAGETRTLAPVARPTSLAGTPLHQLGYCSI